MSDADLHGLVDGRLETDRQVDLLRRVKSRPADRARIDAWREQNDLLRASFSDVEHEPLPVSLDIAPPPRLRCVTSDGHQTPPLRTTTPGKSSEKRRDRTRFLAFGAALVAFGVVCAALFVLHGESGNASFAISNGSLDDRLASRAMEALAAPPVDALSSQDLPTLAIPDLTIAGFGFVNATVRANRPPALIFTYENDAAERLVVAVSKAARRSPAKVEMPFQIGRAIAWHAEDKVFAVAGTVEARRLSAIALDLQTSQAIVEKAE